MKSVSLLFAIFLLNSSFAFGAPSSAVSAACEKKIDVPSLMKAGMPADTAPDKIYRFVKIHDEFGETVTTDLAKATCIGKLYKQGLDEEGEYWGKRLADMGCQLNDEGRVIGNCDKNSEAVKSSEFVSNMSDEFTKEATEVVESSRAQREEEAVKSESARPACAASVAVTVAEAKTALCCGTKASGGGAIRGIEPNLSYSQCIEKTKPVGYGAKIAAEGLGMCAVNAVTSAIKMLWDSVTSIFKLPGQLWGARAQIYSLMTDSKARAQFAARMKSVITAFFADRYHGLFTCYNGYEQTQFVCKTAGQIIGLCAAPESIGALFGLAMKPVGVAAKALGNVLSGTRAGAKFLKGVEVSSNAAARAGTKAKALLEAAGEKSARAKSAAAAAKRVANRTGEIVRDSFKAGERARKWVNGKTRLTVPAEKLALLVSKNGVYRRALLAAYRAEKASQKVGTTIKIASAIERAEPLIAPKPSTRASVSAPAPEKPAGFVDYRAKYPAKKESVLELKAADSVLELGSAEAPRVGAQSPRASGSKAAAVMSQPELATSQAYLDRFSAKVEKFSSTGNNEREALKTFRSATPYKIRLEADSMHVQVDELESAGKIPHEKAKSYHDNISLSESYATKTARVREWTTASSKPTQKVLELGSVEAPVYKPKQPVLELGSEEAPVYKPSQPVLELGSAEAPVYKPAQAAQKTTQPILELGSSEAPVYSAPKTASSFNLRDRVRVSNLNGAMREATIVGKDNVSATVMWREKGKADVKRVPLSDLHSLEVPPRPLQLNADLQLPATIDLPVDKPAVQPSVSSEGTNNWSGTRPPEAVQRPRNTWSGPHSYESGSVEAKAEEMLARPLEEKEAAAVRKAHEICPEGPGWSGAFSYSCRFRKTRACMSGLSRQDCKILLDEKVLGHFPVEKRNLNAEFEEITALDQWAQSYQTSRVLSKEDKLAVSSAIDSAVEMIAKDESARDLISKVKDIRMRVAADKPVATSLASLAPTAYTEKELVHHLQTGVPMPELSSKGIPAVTMNKQVVQFLQGQPGATGEHFLHAIHRGYVASQGSVGITRISALKNTIEVKVLGESGSFRLLGCIRAAGTIELMSVFKKRGDAGSVTRFAKGLCS